jgi:ComF family protein
MIGQALRLLTDSVYPPRCLSCQEETLEPSGLCAACWAETGFIAGLTCSVCGTPIAGQSRGNETCDTCLQSPPAFRAGKAALLYEGGGRKLALALKHGDRLDMVRPLAAWMSRAGAELIAASDLVAPVPLHWRRLLKRKYNQSSELARLVAANGGKLWIPDLLVRRRATPSQDGLDRAARFANQAGAFVLHRRHASSVAGKRLLLIDDVMTTGATLSACADACLAGGAEQVDVLVLARVAREA